MGRAVAARRLVLAGACFAAIAGAGAAGAQPAYRVKDIGTTGPTGSRPRGFVSMGGITYFAATDLANGDELWRSDGTAAGTWLVRDMSPGAISSNPGQLTPAGSTLFFAASDSLWRTDGTEAGTTRLRPDAFRPQDLAAIGSHVYFTAEDPVNGRELWRSDGTDAGTTLVRDIRPGPASSYPSSSWPWGRRSISRPQGPRAMSCGAATAPRRAP